MPVNFGLLQKLPSQQPGVVATVPNQPNQLDQFGSGLMSGIQQGASAANAMKAGKGQDIQNETAQMALDQQKSFAAAGAGAMAQGQDPFQAVVDAHMKAGDAAGAYTLMKGRQDYANSILDNKVKTEDLSQKQIEGKLKQAQNLGTIGATTLNIQDDKQFMEYYKTQYPLLKKIAPEMALDPSKSTPQQIRVNLAGATGAAMGIQNKLAIQPQTAANSEPDLAKTVAPAAQAPVVPLQGAVPPQAGQPIAPAGSPPVGAPAAPGMGAPAPVQPQQPAPLGQPVAQTDPRALALSQINATQAAKNPMNKPEALPPIVDLQNARDRAVSLYQQAVQQFGENDPRTQAVKQKAVELDQAVQKGAAPEPKKAGGLIGAFNWAAGTHFGEEQAKGPSDVIKNVTSKSNPSAAGTVNPFRNVYDNRNKK